MGSRDSIRRFNAGPKNCFGEAATKGEPAGVSPRTNHEPNCPGADARRLARIRGTFGASLMLVMMMCAVLAADVPGQGGPPTVERIQFFENSIRPLLTEHCFKCH